MKTDQHECPDIVQISSNSITHYINSACEQRKMLHYIVQYVSIIIVCIDHYLN